MSTGNHSPVGRIETVLVCYTQTSFERLEPPSGASPDMPDEEAGRATYLAELASRLVTALTVAECRAEVVKLPQRSFDPGDISKAAFAWRILDLKESNGRAVDLALCLDFPAWSLQHPNKCVWLTALPNFVVRSKVTAPSLVSPSSTTPAETQFRPLPRTSGQAENARAVAALLQAERRGLAEARRILAGSRPVAEDLARRGLMVEFNPLPPELAAPAEGPEWQAALKRLLKL